MQDLSPEDDSLTSAESWEVPDIFSGYQAVVKILVTEQSPDWINPWQVCRKVLADTTLKLSWFSRRFRPTRETYLLYARDLLKHMLEQNVLEFYKRQFGERCCSD